MTTSPGLRFEESTIPDELRRLPQWVAWRHIHRDGQAKPTKLPLAARTGSPASTADSSTWGTFERAADFRGADGIGFVFTEDDPYVGIDLDDCRDPDTGELTDLANSIVEQLDSYTEISPSGTGIHIIVRGVLPPGRRRKDAVEMYEDGRYFTMTGNALEGASQAIQECSAELADLHREVFGEHRTTASASTIARQPASDHDLIELAIGAANGAKFAALWGGNFDGYTSRSEADLALCGLLTYWAGPDQGRIDQLFRESGLMRPKWDERRGSRTYGELTILRAISSAPATTGEVVVSELLNGFARTDAGNAEAFAAIHDGRVRYDHRLDRWLLWGPHRWIPDGVDERRLLARSVARARLKAAADISDDDQRKKAMQHSMRSESRYQLDAMLDLAKSEPSIRDRGDGWDAAPYLMGVENGVLDLRSGTLRAGRPDDRITLASHVPYHADATCPRFQRFLREVFLDDEAVISFMKRAVGYSLTADTSEHALFLLHGTGRNGKSVFLNVLRRLAGEYALNLPFSALEMSGRSNLTPELALLPGKRIATSSETNDGTRLNEARIKAMTGGDSITANPKYVTPFEFDPVAKYWLAVNHLPVIRDDSEGFWRRVMLVRLKRAFSEEERDRHLEDALAMELPGILAWAVQGALEWQRDGLRPPDSIRLATDEYRSDSDPLGDFLTTHCVLSADLSVGATALRKAYVSYAETVGISARERMNPNRFGRRMGERFAKLHTKTGNVYTGIGLLSDREGEAFSPGEAFEGGSPEITHRPPREEDFLENASQSFTQPESFTSPTCGDGCGANVPTQGELCDRCLADATELGGKDD